MANTYTAIATVTVGSGGASSIDFTSIPSTYTDLCLLVSIRDNNTAGGNFQGSAMEINSDSANQPDIYIYGDGSSAGSGTNTGQWSWMNTGSSTALVFSSVQLYFPNYTSSNYKSISIDGVTEQNGTSAIASLKAKIWQNTAAITSISIKSYSGSSVIVQYSTATLYGIKNS